MYEEIYLRVLTGRVVGKAIADLGVNKMAVVAPKNIICSSMAAAIETSFLDHSEGISGHFEKAPEGYELIVFTYGGESSPEEMKKAFVESLRDMAKREVESDVMIHVRTFAMGGLDEALKDEKIKEYLEERTVFVYTVDLDKGKLIMNEIVFAEEEYQLIPILEYNLTLEHTVLLNKSLKNRSLCWSE